MFLHQTFDVRFTAFMPVASSLANAFRFAFITSGGDKPSQIPFKFDFSGVPHQFLDRRFFFLYPAMNVGLYYVLLRLVDEFNTPMRMGPAGVDDVQHRRDYVLGINSVAMGIWVVSIAQSFASRKDPAMPGFVAKMLVAAALLPLFTAKVLKW